MTQLTPEDRFFRIVEDALCIGCGLCEALSDNEIKVGPTKDGSLRPFLDRPPDAGLVDRIFEVCPGTRIASLPDTLVDAKTETDLVWGPYRQILMTHASDQDVRFRAATGGALTALSLYLLESGQVDFIVHAKASKTHPSFGEPNISRTRADVLEGAGSRYGPTATLIDIDDRIAEERPFAFIGTPCDVTALRNLARLDERVDKFCRIMMTPVCGGFMETPALSKRVGEFGIAFERLASLQYRGNGCPGPTRMEQDDGKAVEKTYLDFWGEDESAWSLPWRCKICPDGIGEAADIAASDTWIGGAPSPEQASDHHKDPGSNAVLARSSRGQTLLNEAIEAGYLTAEKSLSPRDMDRFQPHQLRKKLALGARLQGIRHAGHLAPETVDLRLEALMAQNTDEENRSQFEGTVSRIRAGKARESRPQHSDAIGGAAHE